MLIMLGTRYVWFIIRDSRFGIRARIPGRFPVRSKLSVVFVELHQYVSRRNVFLCERTGKGRI